jgi:hypothetical protein
VVKLGTIAVAPRVIAGLISAVLLATSVRLDIGFLVAAIIVSAAAAVSVAARPVATGEAVTVAKVPVASGYVGDTVGCGPNVEVNVSERVGGGMVGTV